MVKVPILINLLVKLMITNVKVYVQVLDPSQMVKFPSQSLFATKNKRIKLSRPAWSTKSKITTIKANELNNAQKIDLEWTNKHHNKEVNVDDLTRSSH